MIAVIAELAVLGIIKFDSDRGAVSLGKLDFAGHAIDAAGHGDFFRPQYAAVPLFRLSGRVETDFRRLLS